MHACKSILAILDFMFACGCLFLRGVGWRLRKEHATVLAMLRPLAAPTSDQSEGQCCSLTKAPVYVRRLEVQGHAMPSFFRR